MLIMIRSFVTELTDLVVRTNDTLVLGLVEHGPFATAALK